MPLVVHSPGFRRVRRPNFRGKIGAGVGGGALRFPRPHRPTSHPARDWGNPAGHEDATRWAAGLSSDRSALWHRRLRYEPVRPCGESPRISVEGRAGVGGNDRVGTGGGDASGDHARHLEAVVWHDAFIDRYRPGKLHGASPVEKLRHGDDVDRGCAKTCPTRRGSHLLDSWKPAPGCSALSRRKWRRCQRTGL